MNYDLQGKRLEEKSKPIQECIDLKENHPEMVWSTSKNLENKGNQQMIQK